MLTLVGLRVQALMELEVHELCELGVALGALERPVAVVQAAVGLQVRCGREAFAARRTRKGLLARVHHDVLLQVS